MVALSCQLNTLKTSKNHVVIPVRYINSDYNHFDTGSYIPISKSSNSNILKPYFTRFKKEYFFEKKK
jgi:hypothetical protein